jgi:TIR domain
MTFNGILPKMATDEMERRMGLQTVLTSKHVFISYSHSDEVFERRLAQDLEHAGITVWVDQDDLQPGTPNWDQAIRESLSRSFAFVLVASPTSMRSLAVHGELAVARALNLPVYPV